MWSFPINDLDEICTANSHGATDVLRQVPYSQTRYFFHCMKFQRMKGEVRISLCGRQMKCMPVRKQRDNADTCRPVLT